MNTVKFSPYNEYATEQHDVGKPRFKEVVLDGTPYLFYQPLNVNLFITTACPNSCPFCINRYRDGDFDLEAATDILKKLKAAGLQLEATITGGEPTMRTYSMMDAAQMLYALGIPGRTVTAAGINDLSNEVLAKLIECNCGHNISISRMALGDADNTKIFGYTGNGNGRLFAANLSRVSDFCDIHGGELRISNNLIKGYVDSLEGMECFLDIMYSVAKVKSVLYRELIGNFEYKVPVLPIQKEIAKSRKYVFRKDISGAFYDVKEYLYTSALSHRKYIARCYQGKQAVEGAIPSVSLVNTKLYTGFSKNLIMRSDNYEREED